MSSTGIGSQLPLQSGFTMPDDEQDEYVDIDGERGRSLQSMEMDDGTMLVTLPGMEEEADDTPADAGEGFYENLAEILPDSVMARISSDLLQKIEQDKEARSDRDKQYEEGMRRTGLGKDAPGGAQFEGASRVVHPMLTEACVDYEAHIIKELWPQGANGPVRPNIMGEVTRDKSEKAKRKTEFMNFQLNTQMVEARDTVEQTLMQSPLGGAGFISLWQDRRLGRPRMQFVPIDKVYLPANAVSYHSATRRTFSDTINQVDFKQRVESKMYRDVTLGAPASAPEQSKTEKANDKIEGVKKDTPMNVDGDREVYITTTYLEVTPEMVNCLDGVETAGLLYPYLITIDVQSKQVLSFYRDWEENDEARQPIDHLFEFPFIPWRGAYPIGLPHMIGGLSGAATGSLRALLDSAQISNMQGGLILKGSSTSGQTRTAQPGEYTEIEGSLEADDIRKKVMQFNSKEPSATLFQLLGFVVDAAKNVVRTTMDDSAIDSSTTVPVGTQMARIEQGLIVFSGIHGRTHAAFNRLLAGLHRLNRLYLPEQISVDAQGKEIFVRRDDFEGPPDVQPVSDPTVYSDQQRQAQITGLEQSATAFPGLYDLRAIQEWKMDIWRIPDAKRFLTPKPEPQELNPINENAAMSFGRPVTAFPDQDHLAHIQAHLDFMASPMLGMNPLIAPKFLSAALQHIAEHIVYHYVKVTSDLVSGAAGVPATELMDTEDDEVKTGLDRLLALTSQFVVPMIGQDFAKVGPIIQQAMQLVQQMAPKPPMDPALAAVQAAGAETQRKTAADQANAQIDAKRLEGDQATKVGALQIQQRRNDIAADANRIKEEDSQRQALTHLQETRMDNDTAQRVAFARLVTGKGPGVSDGKSLGRG